jgi:hypothetical protein
MKVYVKHSLSCGAVGVQNKSVATLRYPQFSRNLFCDQNHFADQRSIFFFQFVDTLDVFAWYYQNVMRRLRIHIPERDHLFVFKNLVSGNPSLSDPAKDTFSHYFALRRDQVLSLPL